MGDGQEETEEEHTEAEEQEEEEEGGIEQEERDKKEEKEPGMAVECTFLNSTQGEHELLVWVKELQVNTDGQ